MTEEQLPQPVVTASDGQPPHVAEAIRDIRRNGGPVTRVIYRG